MQNIRVLVASIKRLHLAIDGIVAFRLCSVCMSYLFVKILESALHTSITVKSNARIGEVVFTVPDNSSNTQLMTDITLCKISKYFKVASKGRGKLTIPG